MTPPLTPRETSPESENKPKTFGSFYTQITEWWILSPEEEDILRKKVLEKYGGISGMLKKRKEFITEATRRELDELFTDSPNKDQILAKLDPFLPGAKTLDAAKTVAVKLPEEVKAWVTQAQEALWSLPDTAQKAAQAALASWGQAAWAVAQALETGNIVQAGAELSKAADSWSGKITKVMDAVWAILAWIFSIGSGNSSKKWAELLGKIGMGTVAWVAATGKEKAGGILDAGKTKLEEGRKLLSDVEKWELIGEKYWAEFTNAGWIKDPVRQKKQFKEVFDQYAWDLVDITKEMGANISDPNKKWNAFDSLWKVAATPSKFILALIAKDIIPKQAIATTIYDTGRASLRVYLLSPHTLISNGPSQFLHDFGIIWPSDISWLKDAEKQALIGVMSHTMAVPLYLSGKLTSSLSRIALLGSYWDQGTGKAKIFASVDSMMGDFVKAANQVDGPGGILDMLGNNETTQSLKDYTKDMRNIAEEMKMRALVTETFRSMQKTGSTPAQIADEIEKLSLGKKIVGLDLTKMRTTVDLTEARSTVSEYITRGKSGLTWLDETKGFFRNSVAPLSAHKDNLALFKNHAEEALWNYGRALDGVLKADAKVPILSELVATWKKLKLGWATSELIDWLERWHLPVKVANVTDAKWVMEQLIKTIPKGFEHLFAGVTIFLTIQHVAEAKPEDKLKTAIYDIMAINPLFGWMMLMYEGATMEGGTPTKMAYFAGGGVVTALGTKQALSMIAQHGLGWWLWRLAISPITMTYEAGTAAIRWTRYAYSLARFGTHSGGMAPFLRARAPGALMVGGVITYLVMHEIFRKETEELMRSAWFFKKDGTIDDANIKTAWSKVPSDKKPKILQELLTWVFDKKHGVMTTLKEDNSVVVHSSSGSDSVSITADVFDAIHGMFGDLGISNPKIFMSEHTTADMKKAIDALPVDLQRKQEFMKRFGIMT